MIEDDALTNHGIHQLFTDHFEGQIFTLQIITYVPSKEQPSLYLIHHAASSSQTELPGSRDNS